MPVLETAGAKQEMTERNTRFKKGKSGNPKGKAPGTRNKVPARIEQLLAEQGDAVVKAVLAKAQKGDMQAARLVLDRICPPRKGHPVNIDLPPIECADDVMSAIQKVLLSASRGEISLEEAGGLARLIETARRGIELVDFAKQIEELEEYRNAR